MDEPVDSAAPPDAELAEAEAKVEVEEQPLSAEEQAQKRRDAIEKKERFKLYLHHYKVSPNRCEVCCV